jgi:hypothetical protein
MTVYVRPADHIPKPSRKTISHYKGENKMKFKTTKKAVKNGFYRIIGVGYCSMQYLLNFEQARAYSTRAEGWACDYYDIDGACISTGYAPMSCKNAHVDYKMLDKYERQARAIADGDKPLDDKETAVKRLLRAFVAECLA